MGMMIIFPEDLDFYEQSEAAQRWLREERERREAREEAWWELVREEGGPRSGSRRARVEVMTPGAVLLIPGG